MTTQQIQSAPQNRTGFERPHAGSAKKLKRILLIVGARPNFPKIAPIHSELLARGGLAPEIVHTGQHYDERMSDVFFRQLGIPEPDVSLGIGGGSHAEQTGRVMMAFEKTIHERKPDVVLVVGDVNSTVACALVGKKCGLPVAHVEAGLRSRDRAMPEEINRLITDSISDLLFASEESGVTNLIAEGVSHEKIFHTGNVMIDSLVRFREKAATLPVMGDLGLTEKEFILATMHRPANVDTPERLREVVRILEGLSREKRVLFPCHPRTAGRLREFGLAERMQTMPNLTLADPLGYLEFLQLMEKAALVVTDAGGIQEETTYLQVPCLTLRENTERPATVEIGTNELMPLDEEKVVGRAREIFRGTVKQGRIPPLWDGRAAQRIVDVLLQSI